MIFEVFMSPSKLWYFHLKIRGNNEIIAQSEGYYNRSDIVDLHMKYFSNWKWTERG